MRYSIKSNWSSTFESLSKNSVLFTPFIIIAFLECLALELFFFSARTPLVLLFGPIIKKIFGEQFLHYPGNLVLLPRLFYYGQIVIYILAGAFLTAIAVKIFVNIRTGHPVILKAIIKGAGRRYLTFVGYGLIYIALIFILERGEGFAFLKFTRLISRHLFKISPQIYSIGAAKLLFFTFVIVQIFLALTIPIVITEKKALFKAILGSISIGMRHFLKVFCLVLVPLLLYLPLIFMKTFLVAIIDKTFPDISLYITFLGIVAAIFIDCFVMMSLTQFLLDTKKAK